MVDDKFHAAIGDDNFVGGGWPCVDRPDTADDVGEGGMWGVLGVTHDRNPLCIIVNDLGGGS